MNKRNYFWLVCISFLFGVGYGLIFWLDVMAAVIFFTILTIVFIFFFDKRKFIFIFVIFFLVGMVRVELMNEPLQLGTPNEIMGVVVSELDKKEHSVRYILKDDDGSRVLIIDEYPSNIEYGFEIYGKGYSKVPEDFITDTGRIFPYEKYLRKDKINTLFYLNEVEVLLENNNASVAIGYLYEIKQSFLKKLNKIIPEPESSLLGGILLGVKTSLGKNLIDLFIATGLIHIVVLSGYNITLVSDAIRRGLFFLSRGWQLFFSGLFIILFVIMVGASIPAVRAGLMALLSIVALHFNRTYLAIRGLLLIFVILVAFKPYSLIYDVSLHLSVLATFGLLILSPIIATQLQSFTDKFSIRTIVAATIGTQIFILPYLIYQLGTFSIVGVVANLIVLPIVPSDNVTWGLLLV